MASRVSATGVATTPGPNGSLPLRREIRDLQSNYKDQFNLYLLALADLQKKPATDLLSYYQVAGVHGEPYVPWNGVAGDGNATFGGYCTHSSILFLTWHRPYLAIYEQALYASVQNIAGKYAEPLRTRYLAAAKDFRMPYWDWALRITGQTSAFPTAVSSSTISVVDVDGATKQINNPLYTFRFDDKQIPSELALDDYWSRFSNTKRAPNRSGNSQNAVVSQVINNEAASLRNNVSLLLLSYKQFDAVSNNAWDRSGNAGQYGSLEDVHNEIHDKVGQNGHMSSLEVSSFDPVFWLHHTNVDRLWAIWQALNPSAYVIDKTAQAREANFTIAAGTHVTASTELKPFYDASGTKFWDSTGVKDTSPFGHAYSETQRWLYPSDQAYQTALRNDVTRQYGANVINNFFANIASLPEPKDASTSGADVNSSPATGLAKTTSDSAAPQRKNSIKDAITHPFQAVKKALNSDSANASQVDTTNASIPRNHKDPATDNISAVPSQHPTASLAAPVSIPIPAPAPVLIQPQAQIQGHAQQPIRAESSSNSTDAAVPLDVPKEFVHLFPDRTYTEWITNIRTQKHGLSQTFRVYVFLGDFPSDASAWPTTYNVVGRFTVLGRGPTTGCAKCQQDATDQLVVTGTVPLTSALLQDIVAGQLASLDVGDVEGYLEKNLHWRITGFDGQEIERSAVPGLKVSVVSTSVRIGDDGVPVYTGIYEGHEGITDGRPAGLGSGDEV